MLVRMLVNALCPTRCSREDRRSAFGGSGNLMLNPSLSGFDPSRTSVWWCLNMNCGFGRMADYWRAPRPATKNSARS